MFVDDNDNDRREIFFKYLVAKCFSPSLSQSSFHKRATLFLEQSAHLARELQYQSINE